MLALYTSNNGVSVSTFSITAAPAPDSLTPPLNLSVKIFICDKIGFYRNILMKGAMIMADQKDSRRLDGIIFRLADGDKSALAEFYGLVSGSVYAFALSLVKNRADAEDILSELVLEVWRCAPNYTSMGKPMAWVITVTRNLCLQRLRERSRLADSSFDEAADGLFAENSLDIEDAAAIKACLETLCDGEREVVVLHAVAGLKHREIAEIMGLPLSTVLSRYQRAIKKLNKEFGGILQ